MGSSNSHLSPNGDCGKTPESKPQSGWSPLHTPSQPDLGRFCKPSDEPGLSFELIWPELESQVEVLLFGLSYALFLNSRANVKFRMCCNQHRPRELKMMFLELWKTRGSSDSLDTFLLNLMSFVATFRGAQPILFYAFSKKFSFMQFPPHCWRGRSALNTESKMKPRWNKTSRFYYNSFNAERVFLLVQTQKKQHRIVAWFGLEGT